MIRLEWGRPSSTFQYTLFRTGQTLSDSSTAKMFTEDTYLLLGIYFKITKLLSNAPFEYKANSKSFQEIPFWSKVWYVSHLSWCLLRTAWHSGWMVSNLFYGFPSVPEAALEAAFLIFNTSVLFVNITSFWNCTSIVSFWNRMLVLNAKLKSHYMLEQSSTSEFNDGCAIFLQLLTPSGISTSIVVGLLFTIQPYNRLYFYNLIPMEKTTWTFVIYATWECYSNCWQISILFSVWFQQLLFAKSSTFWIRQIWYDKLIH